MEEVSSANGFAFIMLRVIPILVALGFLFVFGTLIVRAVRGAKQWKQNNASPVLTVDATVKAKRADVQSYYSGPEMDHARHTASSTRYYVTFEVESGDRMEFSVRDTEYGLLAEGDTGKLSFQGTRYLGFERGVPPER